VEEGVASLAVIKASIDYSLNTDAEILEADPVIYMVFREDRDRMAGLISFLNQDGERVETAYSTTELDRSWSRLSQSMLTKAPTGLSYSRMVPYFPGRHSRITSRLGRLCRVL